MEKNVRIAVVLSANDKLSSAINSAVNKSIKSLKRVSESSFQVARTAGGVGLGLGALLIAPLKAAADMERMQIALRTSFKGSREAADAAFKTINTFAAKTPYELNEVMTSFIKLKNMGLDPSMEALTAYGNTASAMGKSLDQMIEAVADAATGEFERLKEFGIRASSQGDKVKFTFQGVSTTVRKNSKEIEGYLKKIGNTKFAGGIEAQSKSLYGQLSTLKDNATMAASSIGSTLIPAVNDLFQKIQPVVNKIVDWSKANPELTRTSLKVIAASAALAFSVSGVSFAVGGLTVAASASITVISGLGKALLFMGRLIFQIGASLYANPIILAVMAIAGAAYLIYKYWSPIKAFFIGIWNAIKEPVMIVFNIIKALFLNFTPLGIIIKHWGSISPYLINLWNGIKTIISISFSFIKDLFLNFTPLGLIIRHWDKISEFFMKFWTPIKAAFNASINFIKNLFLNFTPIGLIIKHWDTIKKILSDLPKYIDQLGDKFFNAGKNIMVAIWEGIKATAMLPIKGIIAVVQKIRDHFPFSPAKTGPLQDIHRIKLMETVAGSIKIKPVLNAMGGAMNQVKNFTGSGRGPSPRPSLAGVNSRGGNFHFEINNNGPISKEAVPLMAREFENIVKKVMRDERQNQQRVSYGL
jgi:hypothetical protein